MTSEYYVPLQFEPLQDMLGGLPLGTITGFVGPPQTGKSTVMFQAAVEAAMKMKKNILVFDTENKFHTYMELTNVFANRYQTDLNIIKTDPVITVKPGKDSPEYEVEWTLASTPSKDAINVFLVRCPDIKNILILWGRGADIKIFEGSGKVQAMLLRGAWAEDATEIPMVKFVEKYNIGPQIVDSITQPFDEFPAISSNFPARADLTQLLFIQIHKAAAVQYLPVMVAVHESTNPTDAFSKGLKMEGGKSVGYNLEYVIYLLLKNDMGLLPKGAAKPPTLADNERAMFVMRRPNTRSFARYRLLEYAPEDQGGFVAKEE